MRHQLSCQNVLPRHCRAPTYKLLIKFYAALAQLVERDLAKVEVTSSSLVCRSKLFGSVKAEWQSGHAADCKSVHLGSTPGSASIQHSTCFKQQTRCPSGGIGRHKGFKIPRLTSRAGSSPASGTTLYSPRLFQFNYSLIKFLIIKSHNRTSILFFTLNYFVYLKPLCLTFFKKPIPSIYCL